MMLSDIFPTGWHSTELARHQARRLRYGLAGPRGLCMPAMSARHSGSQQKVMVIRSSADRSNYAGIGAIPHRQRTRSRPVAQIPQR